MVGLGLAMIGFEEVEIRGLTQSIELSDCSVPVKVLVLEIFLVEV